MRIRLQRISWPNLRLIGGSLRILLIQEFYILDTGHRLCQFCYYEQKLKISVNIGHFTKLRVMYEDPSTENKLAKFETNRRLAAVFINKRILYPRYRS